MPSPVMTHINFHRLLPSLVLVVVLIIIESCTGDFLTDSNKQLSLLTTTTQKQDISSSMSTITNNLGSYYSNTATFLTDNYDVGADSTAISKGIGGGLWGVSDPMLFNSLEFFTLTA